jgi:hypothetical protein
MKRIILSFAIITSACAVVHSQTYYPLPEENAYWKSNYLDLPMFCECLFGLCSKEQYRITGDTLINEMVYHKIDRSGYYFDDNCDDTYFNNGYQGAFRNDIENKKVWFVLAGEDTESILYEFDLEIGDTLTPGILNPNNYWDFWVEDIDSIEIENNFRKLFLIRSQINIGEGPFRIIEGIGGQSLIAEFASWLYFEGGYHLGCLSVNDNLIYGNDCDEIVGSDELLASSTMILCPNPSTGQVWIKDNTCESDPLYIEVLNSVGTKIIHLYSNSKYTAIDLCNQPPGLFLFIIKKGFKIESQKIIIL